MVFPEHVWGEVRAVLRRGVDVEVRGWDEGVLDARGVFDGERWPWASDLASPCPVGRDVYLRRVAGVRVEGDGLLALGRVVHEGVMLPLRLGWVDRLAVVLEEASRVFEERGFDGGLHGLWMDAVDYGLRMLLWARSRGVPVVVEPELSGGPVGLWGRVVPDIVAAAIPVEVVVVSGRGWLERKSLQLAAYALAIEASWLVPVDAGVVVGFRVEDGRIVRVTWGVVPVDQGLRDRFLEKRGRIARILSSKSPPPPPRDGCPRSCPYTEVCQGG